MGASKVRGQGLPFGEGHHHWVAVFVLVGCLFATYAAENIGKEVMRMIATCSVRTIRDLIAALLAAAVVGGRDTRRAGRRAGPARCVAANVTALVQSAPRERIIGLRNLDCHA